MNINIIRLTNNHTEYIKLISEWYFLEWGIEKIQTINNFNNILNSEDQFQLLLLGDNIPLATAGLYHEVGLTKKNPSYKIYKNWLALVYTVPSQRGKGLGKLICKEIEKVSKQNKITNLYLFTDNAENLYKRMNWEILERISYGERNIVIMNKELSD